MTSRNNTEKTTELKEAVDAQAEFYKRSGFNNASMNEYREKKGELDISQENEPFWIDEDQDQAYQNHCKKLLGESYE